MARADLLKRLFEAYRRLDDRFAARMGRAPEVAVREGPVIVR